jgi:hypothetical protein
MAVLDEDFCTDLTTPEGGDTLWSLPFVVPAYGNRSGPGGL